MPTIADCQRKDRERGVGGKEIGLIADSLGEYQIMRTFAHNEMRTDIIGISIAQNDTDFRYELYARDSITKKPVLQESVKPLYWFLRGIQAAYKVR